MIFGESNFELYIKIALLEWVLILRHAFSDDSLDVSRSNHLSGRIFYKQVPAVQMPHNQIESAQSFGQADSLVHVEIVARSFEDVMRLLFQVQDQVARLDVGSFVAFAFTQIKSKV